MNMANVWKVLYLFILNQLQASRYYRANKQGKMFGKGNDMFPVCRD